MNAKDMVLYFLIVFAVTFIANAAVIWLYNLIAHGAGAFDWAMSFRMGFTFGIVMTYINYKQEKGKGEKEEKEG